MKNIYIFLIRIVVSLVIASLMSMFFFNGVDSYKTPALAAGLLFFAYIFESTRNKK